MRKISTIYFIVNTIASGKKQFGLFDLNRLPVKGGEDINEVLNYQERLEYDVRDEVVKNILDFSVVYRNNKKS